MSKNVCLKHKTSTQNLRVRSAKCRVGGEGATETETGVGGGGGGGTETERDRERESIQNQQTNSFPLAERKANIKPFSALLVLPLGGLRSIKRNMIRVNILVATRNEEKRVI